MNYEDKTEEELAVFAADRLGWTQQDAKGYFKWRTVEGDEVPFEDLFNAQFIQDYLWPVLPKYLCVREYVTYNDKTSFDIDEGEDCYYTIDIWQEYGISIEIGTKKKEHINKTKIIAWLKTMDKIESNT